MKEAGGETGIEKNVRQGKAEVGEEGGEGGIGMIDELFKPGTYRTSNHGDLWRHVIENMPDGAGRVVARCENDDDAERIVREHNAHEDLVAACMKALDWVCDADLAIPPSMGVLSGEDMARMLQAAIAKATITPPAEGPTQHGA